MKSLFFVFIFLVLSLYFLKDTAHAELVFEDDLDNPIEETYMAQECSCNNDSPLKMNYTTTIDDDELRLTERENERLLMREQLDLEEENSSMINIQTP
jgi:hypothetical protein